MKSRADRYELRKIRVRRKIYGTTERPRLSVYRSLKHIYAQIIDDVQGRTLVAASTQEKGMTKGSNVNAATAVGKALGQKATKKGIKRVVFDRGARQFTGRVKALADSVREAGLEF